MRLSKNNSSQININIRRKSSLKIKNIKCKEGQMSMSKSPKDYFYV